MHAAWTLCHCRKQGTNGLQHLRTLTAIAGLVGGSERLCNQSYQNMPEQLIGDQVLSVQLCVLAQMMLLSLLSSTDEADNLCICSIAGVRMLPR